MILKWEHLRCLRRDRAMDVDDLIKEIDQNIEWFCNKTMTDVPDKPDEREKIFKRMMTLGWIRQSEVDTYNELMKD